MLKYRSTIQYITIKNGLYIFVGLVALFLLVKALGLVHIVELRGLNFPIMVTGIWLTFRRYKKSCQKKTTRLNTLVLGVRTTLTAMIPFAFFVFTYLKFDPALLEHIRATVLFGYHLNARLLALLVTCEGLLSGIFISYTLTQHLINGQLTIESEQLEGKSQE